MKKGILVVGIIGVIMFIVLKMFNISVPGFASSNPEKIVKEITDNYLKGIPHTEHESFNNFAGVTKNSDFSFNDFTFKELKLAAVKENKKYEKYNVYLVRYTFKLNEDLSPDIYFEVSNKKDPKEYTIEGIGTN